MGDTNDGAVRDAKKLGLPKVLILGLQHMFAMLGETILVPILVSVFCRFMWGAIDERSDCISHTFLCRLCYIAFPCMFEV